MLLKVNHRLNLKNILPVKGSFDELIIFEDVKKKIDFTQEELKELNLQTKTENEQLLFTWDNTKDNGKEVEFTGAEKEKLKSVLKNLSDTKELTTNLLEIYKMFN